MEKVPKQNLHLTGVMIRNEYGKNGVSIGLQYVNHTIIIEIPAIKTTANDYFTRMDPIPNNCSISRVNCGDGFTLYSAFNANDLLVRA